MKWTYGIVSTEERKEDLLPRTITSLYHAGFDKPRLFIDNYIDNCTNNTE